jgi:hypothetical protein
MYFGSMLVVGVVAFAARRQVGMSLYLDLDKKNCQLETDTQTASKELKAA